MILISRQHLAILLVVSLALNLFLGGMIVSRLLSQEDDRPMRTGTMSRMALAAEPLAESSRQKTAAIREQHEAAIQERMLVIRQTRQEINRLLSAETLDRPQLEQAMATLAVASQDVKNKIHSMMLEIASVLPPAERKIYFEGLRPMRGRGGHRHNRPIVMGDKESGP